MVKIAFNEMMFIDGSMIIRGSKVIMGDSHFIHGKRDGL
jgi:hypothetical protein